MLQIIKRILIGILLGLFILTASIAGYFYLNQDEIVNLLIKEVNRRVNTQIDVKTISMSFWKRFPNISIRFENIVIHSAKAYSGPKDTVLQSRNLYFDLDISTLISDAPQIKRIFIENGQINIATDRNGEANYNVFKQAEDQKDKASALTIESFALADLTVHYNQEREKYHYSCKIVEAMLEGTIAQEIIQIDSKITLSENNIIPSKYNFFRQYTWEGEINYAKSRYKWQGAISAGSLTAKTTGSYNTKKERLVATAQNFTVSDQLAGRVLEKLNIGDIKLVSGNFQIANLQYQDIKGYKPLLTISYAGHHTLKYLNKDIRVKSSGKLKYNSYQTKLRFYHLTAEYNKSTARFEGNFTYPANQIQGLVTFSAQLKEWADDFKSLPVTGISGLIDGKAELNMTIDDEIDYKQMFTHGNIGLKNVSLTLRENGLQLDNINSALHISPALITVDSLTGAVNQNPINYSGQIEHLFDYLAANKPMKITGEATADHFDLGSFLMLSESESPSKPFTLTDKIRVDIKFLANRLIHNDFKAKLFDARIQKYGRRVVLRNLQMNTAEGNVNANGKLLQQQNNEWYVQLNGNLQKVDVSKLFLQMNNFGQSYLKAKNLAGTLNADIQSEFVFYPDFRIHPESVYLIADLTIKNGALINYKTLEALSDYIAVEELQHVKFEELDNRITIKNEMIHIPFMEIHSSAIDIGLTGNHSFDNEIDYQISVGLADVLFRKVRKKHQNTQASKRNNKMMVFLDITGTTDDYELKFSKIKRKKLVPQKTEKPPQKKKFEIEFDDINL